RPIHLDGARALVRFPWKTSIEAFGGFPVAPRFDYRGTFQWTAGGRIAQTFGNSLVIGGSYLEQRQESARQFEEVGADVAITPNKNITSAAHIAFDAMNPGVTEAIASASVQNTKLRVELFSTHRSPGRMLPKTSLFSVLGDLPSTNIGAAI